MMQCNLQCNLYDYVPNYVSTSVFIIWGISSYFHTFEMEIASFCLSVLFRNVHSFAIIMHQYCGYAGLWLVESDHVAWTLVSDWSVLWSCRMYVCMSSWHDSALTVLRSGDSTVVNMISAGKGARVSSAQIHNVPVQNTRTWTYRSGDLWYTRISWVKNIDHIYQTCM